METLIAAFQEATEARWRALLGELRPARKKGRLA
jgi:hypothetical protein